MNASKISIAVSVGQNNTVRQYELHKTDFRSLFSFPYDYTNAQRFAVGRLPLCTKAKIFENLQCNLYKKTRTCKCYEKNAKVGKNTCECKFGPLPIKVFLVFSFNIHWQHTS